MSQSSPFFVCSQCFIWLFLQIFFFCNFYNVPHFVCVNCNLLFLCRTTFIWILLLQPQTQTKGQELIRFGIKNVWLCNRLWRTWYRLCLFMRSKAGHERCFIFFWKKEQFESQQLCWKKQATNKRVSDDDVTLLLSLQFFYKFFCAFFCVVSSFFWFFFQIFILLNIFFIEIGLNFGIFQCSLNF